MNNFTPGKKIPELENKPKYKYVEKVIDGKHYNINSFRKGNVLIELRYLSISINQEIHTLIEKYEDGVLKLIKQRVEKDPSGLWLLNPVNIIENPTQDERLELIKKYN